MSTPTSIEAGTVAASGDRCPRCQAPLAEPWQSCAACRAVAEPAPSPMARTRSDLPPGTRLLGGRFEVGAVLGRGGFGITYQATDTRLGRGVALKELFPDTASREGLCVRAGPDARESFLAARGRFLREARILARFNHPGIVRVFEVFEENDTAYLVLELLDGSSIAEVLRERGRPFTEGAALDLACRVGGALTGIHAAGLLHRDVSPSNLVLTGSGRIVLIDFGLARTFEVDQDTAMTRIVTPGYAPPEQYLDSARYGPATDVYGLAATLYRLLTATTLPSAIDRQHGTSLTPPHRINPDVSPLVSHAVLDGLELDPNHRPQTIDALLARLGVDTVTVTAPTAVVKLPPMATTATPPADRGGAEASAVLAAPGNGSPDEEATELPSSFATWLAPEPLSEEWPSPVEAWLAPTARGTELPAPRPPAPEPPDLRQAPGSVAAHTAAAPFTAMPSTVAERSRQVEARPAVEGVEVDPAAYLPPAVVGPPRKGRWIVALPCAIATIALTATDPVLGVALLVLVVLPAVATTGDLALHRHRQTWGGAQTWFQRRSVAAAALPRFMRNIAVSAARAVPALALLGVVLLCWYSVHDSVRLASASDWLLRAGGVAVGALLVLPALRGSPGFASGTAIDALHLRLSPRGIRLTRQGWILWLVAIALAAAALSFSPEIWPLRS